MGLSVGPGVGASTVIFVAEPLDDAVREIDAALRGLPLTSSDSLNEPVRCLDLAARSRHLLQRMGVDTVHELVSIRAEDLLAQRNCGTETLRDIRGRLRERGLALRGEEVTR